MTVTVQTLENLERKITLTLPVAAIAGAVDQRLKHIAKTVRMHGFRPGKVPMSVVAQQYGYGVHNEVMNDKVRQAFNSAIGELGIKVAGQPRINELEAPAANGDLQFDALFEVFPEVVIQDLSQAQIEKTTVEVDEAAIDRTLEILRKQRRTFAERAKDALALVGDRVTVDFVGTIDGEPFEGGHAKGFTFMVGEGQMLKDFDEGVCGMKAGESKTFTLAFPADYHGKDVAGKTADFMVTLHKIESTHLPVMNDELAKSFGAKEPSIAGLRADVRANLEREVKFRLINKNKQAVMDALIAHAELQLPKAMVQGELQRLIGQARQELKARGVKDADQAPIPEDLFKEQAQRRVRLGLIINELVKAQKLEPTPTQIEAHVREVASSYEKPAEVERWYLQSQERLAEVRAILTENNVVEHVLGKAKVTTKSVAFETFMAQ